MSKSHEKKPAKSKKRVAKHILAAREKSNANVENNVDDVLSSSSLSDVVPIIPSPLESDRPSINKKNKNPSSPNPKTHTKPPTEASNYLILWSSAKEDAWKFNKNTQSWLLRHMYDDDLVNKKTFGLLLEYMPSIKGTGMLERLVKEAFLRAKLYKKFEAASKEETDGAAPAAGNVVDDDSATAETIAANNLIEKEFAALDDHGKRKVFKRCRRIHDVLKELV